MHGQRRGVDAGLLLGGEGVEFAADTIDAVKDMPGAAVLRALEDGVLNEMGHTFVVALFVAGADVDVKSGMSHRGTVLPDDDFQAVI